MSHQPALQLLSTEAIEQIVYGACVVLAQVGVAIEHDGVRELLGAAGQRIEGERAFLTEEALRYALASAPGELLLGDRGGVVCMDMSGRKVHFNPGSAALNLHDPHTGKWRCATCDDCAHFAWVTSAAKYLNAQSTGLIPSDVPADVSDWVRLWIALKNSTKPVVTGTFRKESFEVIKDMLIAVRGDEASLRANPLAIVDCCPTSPLKWSELTCQALIDCAQWGIPAELISVPMAGATGPVTLYDTVVLHCAESLSGILIHQLICPGAPVIYGTDACSFDMRHGTAPSGAAETMLIQLACVQVGRHLGLPTHAYLGMSDAKGVDWQAGAETATGLTLAVLAGVNNVSGPGMLGFIGCQSLEKLVLDDAACGAAQRLSGGIGLGAAEGVVELIRLADDCKSGFLGTQHTRRNFRSQLHFPDGLIDRESYGEWERRGACDAWARAKNEVKSIVSRGNPAPLPREVEGELDAIARRAWP